MGANYRGREKVYSARGAHALLASGSSPKQKEIRWASETAREAFEYGPAPLVMSGGYGAAKTSTACIKLLYLAQMFPGSRWVIARKIWDELKKTTMVTFFQWCPPEAYSYGGRRADSDKILRLNNGSEFIWLHMDNAETEAIVRGIEINGFLFDQAEEAEEAMVDLLMGRLGRWTGAAVPPELIATHEAATGERWPWRNDFDEPIPPSYALFTCNPEHELHWIYRKYHDDSLEHWEKRIPERNLRTGELTGRLLSYADLGYRLMTFRSIDNRYLSDINRKELLTKEQSYIDRYVLGKWGNPKGKIHTVAEMSKLDSRDCVEVQLNNYETLRMPILEWIRRHCALYRILDHGDAAPTACLWGAADRDGNLFIYREYYKPNRLIVDHRARITELSAGETYDQNLADPSIHHLTLQKYGNKWTVADEYADTTILPDSTALFWQPADNNELGTRDRINELLRVDPEHKHPITKQLGAPRLYFIQRTELYPDGCYEAIRETENQQREKIGINLGEPVFGDERNEDISDHAYDCVRYFVAARPTGSSVVKPALHPNSFDAVRKRAKEYHRSGQSKRDIKRWQREVRKRR